MYASASKQASSRQQQNALLHTPKLHVAMSDMRTATRLCCSMLATSRSSDQPPSCMLPGLRQYKFTDCNRLCKGCLMNCIGLIQRWRVDSQTYSNTCRQQATTGHVPSQMYKPDGMRPASAVLRAPSVKSSSSSSSSKYLVSVKIRGVVDDVVLVDRLASQEEVPGLGHEGGQVGGHQLAEELHIGLHQLQSL